MRTYETTFIINPQAEEAALDRQVTAITDLIKANGGEIKCENRIGTRRLAYSIEGFAQGYYTQLFYEAPQAALPELDRFFKLEEAYIRFMTVTFEGKVPTLEEINRPVLERDDDKRSDRDDRHGRRDNRHGRRDDRPAPTRTDESATAKPAEAKTEETASAKTEETAPIEAAPAKAEETAPIETAPAKTEETAPIEAAPAKVEETAPIETAPAKAEETAPIETAPAEKSEPASETSDDDIL